MRKIIQILYDHRSTRPGVTPVFLVLCDDGSVWRQIEVQNPITKVHNGILQIVDPTYHTEWERATEFDKLSPQFDPSTFLPSTPLP